MARPGGNGPFRGPFGGPFGPERTTGRPVRGGRLAETDQSNGPVESAFRPNGRFKRPGWVVRSEVRSQIGLSGRAVWRSVSGRTDLNAPAHRALVGLFRGPVSPERALNGPWAGPFAL